MCRWGTPGMGLDSRDMTSLERSLYGAKILLDENRFEYEVNSVTIQLVEGTSDGNMVRKSLELPFRYYVVDCGNLYFTEPIEDILFYSKDEYNGLVDLDSDYYKYYKIVKKVARVVPADPRDSEQQRTALT